MRRTARALSVAALTGVALGAPASAASADPAAEVSPGTVAPGGSVTVSVTCDALDGSAPATLQATSQAFEEGTVELKRVSGTDEKAAGPVYRGSARVPPAESFEGDPDAAGAESDWTVDGTCPATGGGEGKEWSATFTVARESGGAGSVGAGSDSDPTDSVLTDSGVSDLSVSDSGGGKGSDASGKGEESAGKGEASGGYQGGSGSGSGGGGTGGGHTCKDPKSDWSGAGKAEPYAAESEAAGKAEPGWDGAETGATGGLGGTETGGLDDEGADAGGLGEEGLDTGGTDSGGTGTGGTGAGETGGTGTGGTDASGIAPEWDAGAGKKESGSDDCGGATDQHGVQAGTGGTFTDSVPALVAGGVLIAGAFGGAAYRLRRRTTTPQD
ncbi:hypothetical protein ACFYVK_07640 [Streptomyces chartreusis]|uniref:hypothetical protein n=1 Tax=Streptomyces chartreusis TaxID=1969 RepID=UPI00369BE69D